MRAGALPWWIRACVALLALLLAWLYLLAAARPVYAQQIVEVSYWGQNNVHLRYEYTSACADCQRELVAKVGESTTVLQSFGPGKIEGKYHHRDLDPGQYTYRIVEFRMANDERVEVGHSPSRSVQINERDVGGTLLFDDLLTDQVYCAGITVPDEHTLRIDGLVGSLGAECRIHVFGLLELSDASQTGNSRFYIHSPHYFTGIRHVHLNFQEGSAGSNISHAAHITATIQADALTFADVKFVQISGAGAKNFGIQRGEAIQLLGE